MPNAERVAALLFLLPLLLPAQPGRAGQEIRQVLAEQQTAWNGGDVRRFMDGYEDAAVMVGAGVTKGRAKILEHYLTRYASRQKMGTLMFSELEVRLLDASYASVVGQWHLARDHAAGGDVGGMFTLLFHKTAAGWKIILDHTS